MNNGDGVHQNRLMLMTPTGNTISVPVGVFLSLLFVLVGAQVNVGVAVNAGRVGIIIILITAPIGAIGINYSAEKLL